MSGIDFNLNEVQKYSVGFFPSLEIKIDAPRRISGLIIEFSTENEDYLLDLISPSNSTGLGSEGMAISLVGDNQNPKGKNLFNINFQSLINKHYKKPIKTNLKISIIDEGNYSNAFTLQLHVTSVVRLTSGISLGDVNNQRFYSVRMDSVFTNKDVIKSSEISVAYINKKKIVLN